MIPKIIAGMLDIFGFSCFLLFITGEADLGLFLSFIPDMLGIFLLVTPQLIKGETKIREKSKLLIVTVLLEICPLVGDVLPLWSVSAWKKKK